MNVVHFTVPLAGLAGFLLWREWGRSRGPSRERWRLMASMAAPLAVGVAAPVAAWIAYYAAEGALGDLYTGLFVLPRRRVESGVYELHLQGSKALTGCRDNLITFQQLDAGTLRGRSDAAAEIVLTRR